MALGNEMGIKAQSPGLYLLNGSSPLGEGLLHPHHSACRLAGQVVALQRLEEGCSIRISRKNLCGVAGTSLCYREKVKMGGK